MKFRILSILLFAVNLLYSQIYVNSYRFAGEVEQALEVEYLVVGGGGGAGGTETTFGGGAWFGGGGGAGGLLSGNISTLQTGVNYNVSVGLGGTGGVSSSLPTPGQNGQNSVFDSFTAIGGGGGGGGYNSSNRNGSSGGSGGGGGSNYNAAIALGGAGTSGQGNTGGNGPAPVSGLSASGGGAGGSGNNAAAAVCPGGVGLTLNITGVNVTYSTGGDGGDNSVLGSNGAANTGDGGDRGNAFTSGNGHFGGSGVVILRYPNSYSIITTSGDLVLETSFVGTDKVTTFKEGSGEIQFIEESIPNIVTDNLIAWYDASISTSYPGSGYTWFDLTNGDYDLTITGANYLTDNGGVFDFLGTSSSYASNTSLKNETVLSFFLWLKSDLNFVDENSMFPISFSSTYASRLRLGSAAGAVSNETLSYEDYEFTYQRIFNTSAGLANTWYYIGMVYNTSRGTYDFYVNGSNVSSFLGSDPSLDQFTFKNLTLGRCLTINFGYFNGKIGELQVYSDQLSASEVLQNYNATKTRYFASGPIWSGTNNAILDDYSGAEAAYSVRALSSTYTGPLMQVRRADNGATYDIYALANGNLDETYINTVCSGTDCTVQTWYDQSGNGYNATAPTANQPTIYTGGAVVVENGKPAILWPNYTTAYYLKNTSFSDSYPLTFFTTVYFNGTSNRQDYIFDNGVSTTSTRTSLIHPNEEDVNKFALYGGALSAPFYFSETNVDLTAGQKMFSILFNGSGSYIYKNGSLTTSGASSEVVNNSMNGITIGNYNNSNTIFNWSGKIHELIIYNSNQSTNRANIESNINSYYSIY